MTITANLRWLLKNSYLFVIHLYYLKWKEKLHIYSNFLHIKCVFIVLFQNYFESKAWFYCNTLYLLHNHLQFSQKKGESSKLLLIISCWEMMITQRLCNCNSNCAFCYE